MIHRRLRPSRQRLVKFVIAVVGAGLIAVAPTPEGLSLAGKYALSTMFFAGFLWVTGTFPLAVTALTIPVLLTGFGVYDDMDTALTGFADHLISLFMAGFVLANAVQKYDIDRRIALYTMAKMGSSPRRLIRAVMISTAGLSMWVSNTATTAMMTPIAVGVLTQVLSSEEVASVNDTAVQEDIADSKSMADGGVVGSADDFTNMQIGMLLGTAYAASIGGVGTIIGTPPNAVLVGQLSAALGYEIGFVDWLLIGLPIVFITLPVVWYVLTYALYPPQISSVDEAQEQARVFLEEEDSLSPWGKRVAIIFGATAGLWVLGGLGTFLEPYLPAIWITTLFGGSGMTLFGLEGPKGCSTT